MRSTHSVCGGECGTISLNISKRWEYVKQGDIRADIRFIRRVHTWQLVLILLVTGFAAATFARLNNIGMVERRQAVLAADESGDQEALTQRLYDLQRFVSAHMNADPGKIALQHQYARDSEKVKKEAEASTSANSNGNVYAKAAGVCDPIAKRNGWRWPDPRYTQCVDTELSKYPEAKFQDKITPPNLHLYEHTYVSPKWTPDFAGLSLLVCLVILAIIVARGIMLFILSLMLRRRHKKAQV